MCCPLAGGPAPAPRAGVHGDLDGFFNNDASSIPDAPADDLLRRITTFLQQHNKSLNDMRETLSDTTTEAWNEENTTVQLSMEPQDGVPILSMVTSENAQFNKVCFRSAIPHNACIAELGHYTQP